MGPTGRLCNYPIRKWHDAMPSPTAFEASPAVAVQVYNRAIHTQMMARIQEGQPIKQVLAKIKDEAGRLHPLTVSGETAAKLALHIVTSAASVAEEQKIPRGSSRRCNRSLRRRPASSGAQPRRAGVWLYCGPIIFSDSLGGVWMAGPRRGSHYCPSQPVATCWRPCPCACAHRGHGPACVWNTRRSGRVREDTNG